MKVVKIVDEDIADKIDTQYIAKQFSEVQKVGIVFICTRDKGEEDEWTDEEGLRHIVIHLPYKEVKQMADAKPLMLARVRERLEAPRV